MTTLVTTGFGVTGGGSIGACLVTAVETVTLVGAVFATGFGVEDAVTARVGEMPAVPPVTVDEATAAVLFFFLWDDLCTTGEPSGAMATTGGALVDGGGGTTVTSSSA
ncbi:MAG: hypothetical protein LV481_10460 [Methylacidiphilales bacterium]|nr:hypothetical protein [Candidatus Methylacidiphilales bacterium]